MCCPFAQQAYFSQWQGILYAYHYDSTSPMAGQVYVLPYLFNYPIL